MTGSSSFWKSLYNPVSHFWELDSRVFSHEKTTTLSSRGTAGPALPEIQVLHLQRELPYLWFSQVYLLLAGWWDSQDSPGTQFVPSNQELMQLKISFAIVDPFLFYSCAQNRQHRQPDLGPRHRYPINILDIKYTNQPFRCCIRKSKVKLGDRQWLLLKYANTT